MRASVGHGTILLVVALAGAACDAVDGPCDRERLGRELRQRAGREAIDCGTVRSGEDSATITDCTLGALRRHVPVIAVYEDSKNAAPVSAVAVAPGGALYLYSLYANEIEWGRCEQAWESPGDCEVLGACQVPVKCLQQEGPDLSDGYAARGYVCRESGAR